MDSSKISIPDKFLVIAVTFHLDNVRVEGRLDRSGGRPFVLLAPNYYYTYDGLDPGELLI